MGKISNADLRDLVLDRIIDVINKHFPKKVRETYGVTEIQVAEIADHVLLHVSGDLDALRKKDPTSFNEVELLQTRTSFQAVLQYRTANTIQYYENLDIELRTIIANTIFEASKKETLVEINPSAKIGERFIVDHGTDTVIGQTCEIGNDCYVLQGVILGARGIDNNPSGKRHPTIGNNVRVGGGARILGPINIGDNVIVSPYSVVTEDIPPNYEIVIVNQLQVTKLQKECNSSEGMEFYGIVPEANGIIAVYGMNFARASAELINKEHEKMFEVSISEVSSSESCKRFQLSINKPDDIKGNCENLKNVRVRITINNQETLVVLKSKGLERALSLLGIQTG